METFKVKYSNKKDLNEVVFSGQLIINNIDKIKEDLKKHLKFNKSLNIITKDVENMDLTFVQLIISLIRSGEKGGIEVNTSINVPDDTRLLLMNAGFSGLITVTK